MPGNRRIRYARHMADSSRELWQMANELELEGIVEKDAQSIYTAGRSTRWLKIKTAVGIERERKRRPRGIDRPVPWKLTRCATGEFVRRSRRQSCSECSNAAVSIAGESPYGPCLGTGVMIKG
jgi:hypothetical protein